MFENFTFQRGSDEVGTIRHFKSLAEKAAHEAGAEVMVILKFPGYGHVEVVTSTPTTPEEPVQPRKTWTMRAVVAMLKGVETWKREWDHDLQNEFHLAVERYESSKKSSIK